MSQIIYFSHDDELWYAQDSAFPTIYGEGSTRRVAEVDLAKQIEVARELQEAARIEERKRNPHGR